MLDVKIVSANEWLYPDISEYAACPGIDLHAARGSYACVQLFVANTAPGLPISVRAEGVAMPEAYRLIDALVAHNVGGEGYNAKPDEDVSAFTTRRAPFRVYEVMQPLAEGGDCTIGTATALYVAWPIADDAEPGVGQGSITLKIGEDTATLPVRITTHRAKMPEKSRLSTTNWYSPRALCKQYGVAPASPEWLDLYAKLMALMQRTRQTHILIGLHAIEITRREDGTFAFGFERVRKIIQMAIDAGFETLELGHLGIRNYKKHEPIWLFHQPDGKKLYATSPEAYAFLAQFLPAWADFLRQNGWYGMAVQHVSDEPTLETANDYRHLAGVIRKFMPEMPLFDAIVHPELCGASDYWIPYNSIYQEQQAQWESLRRLGDRIWVYTCCAPGGNWLNRCMDMELLRPRLMHWGNYRFNIDGYLHWGFNYWRDLPAGQSLYEHMNNPADDGFSFWPAGDTQLCYPGVGARGNPGLTGPRSIWMSVRAERMRAGCEDCELLWQVHDRDPARAQALCQAALQGFDAYTKDVAVFEKAALALLQAASQE